MHGRVGAFYALGSREGKQILQIKSFKSVEEICGHTIKRDVRGTPRRP
jgi:hypothetical protein